MTEKFTHIPHKYKYRVVKKKLKNLASKSNQSRSDLNELLSYKIESRTLRRFGLKHEENLLYSIARRPVFGRSRHPYPLIGRFDWDSSPEGHVFWSRIYDKIHGMASL